MSSSSDRSGPADRSPASRSATSRPAVSRPAVSRPEKGDSSKSEASKGEATRARILQRALELTTSVGFERLSIGDLAADLGLSKSGLFAHFGSKEQLQLDVLDAAAESFKAAVFDPVPRGSAGDARVVALFDNILEWIQSRDVPGGCIFMAGAFEWDDAQGPVRQRLVEWHEKFKLGLVRSVSIAVEQRLFRADLDAELFAHELHGILLEYHLEARLMRNRKALSFARRAFQRLLADARG
jgi:AcrR family transcriptional regulator